MNILSQCFVYLDFFPLLAHKTVGLTNWALKRSIYESMARQCVFPKCIDKSQ